MQELLQTLRRAAVLGAQNGRHLRHRLLHGIVDDQIVVAAGGLQLHLGPQQAALDDLLTVGTTGGKAALQLHP